jgi:hypothetical protein
MGIHGFFLGRVLHLVTTQYTHSVSRRKMSNLVLVSIYQANTVKENLSGVCLFQLFMMHSLMYFILFLDSFAELRKVTISFMSVCPQGTNRLSLDGFWWTWYLSFFFSKICREDSSSIKIWQE